MSVIEGVERQRAIEKISVVKARYFRFLDTKDWDGLRDLFTPDAILFYPESNTPPMLRDEILPLMKEFLHDSVTVHHGHMPEIEFTAKDRATGIWPMEDHVFFPSHREAALGMSAFWGYGHYHEDYICQNGEWRIQTLKLTRLRIERQMPPQRIEYDLPNPGPEQ